MAKQYVILKRFSYEDKEGNVHLVERFQKNDQGQYKTDSAGNKLNVVRELSREALDAAKAIKKSSGKPAIDEYDGE